MNIDMHGRRIESIEFTNMDGNPQFMAARHRSTRDGTIEFSATHHGDHDEFWIVVRDGQGVEISRRRAQAVDHIYWETGKPTNVVPA